MKKAHFIGLCGSGMSSVAGLLQENGWQISGSDEGVYDPMKSYLEHIGLTCCSPHDPKNIPEHPDLIVIGKHAKLTVEENAEVAYAYEHYADTIKSFPEVLHELTQDTQNFVVCGSYGKSTSSALLAWCLKDNNLDPSYFVPAISFDLDTTAHKGTSDYFVLEGDEYPSANTDTTSKFLYYNASSLLFTSGEHDHINVFPTIEDYHGPYKQLLKSIPVTGKVIACIDNPYVSELILETNAHVITYSLQNTTAHYYAEHIIYSEISSFDLMHKGSHVIKLETQLLGTHNIQNIIGVCAFILEHGLLSPEQLQKSVRSFRGIVRRLDKKTQSSSVLVFEGFGSSYTKARTAIEALQLHFPDKKLHVVFEPHTFSWRNRGMIDWYRTVFDGTDSVLIYKPPTHGQETHEQLSLDEIFAEVNAHHPRAFKTPSHAEILETLGIIVQAGDVLLILTSGSFDDGIEKMVKWCEERFAKQHQ